jgi:hypothetical protein
MKKLESLKGSKFELSKDELNVKGGYMLLGPDYSMKYYVTNDTDCDGCYDEEVYDMCWNF